MAGSLPANEAVLLIHGLWMVGVELKLLQHRLQQHDFDVEIFSYRMLGEGLDENVQRLAERIRELPQERVHLVGHSLGGVLSLHTLQQFPELTSGRVVCLGSPLVNTIAGRSLASVRFGKALLGKTLPEAVFEYPLQRWQGEQEIGVIAGTLGAGLGMLVTPDLKPPHDGVVTVSETCLPGITDQLELRVNHFGLVISDSAATQTAQFLRHGRFDRG